MLSSMRRLLHPAPLLLIFLIGCVLGVLLEGVWCLIIHHRWETHVTTVWGPFNALYGAGAMLMLTAAAGLQARPLALQFAAYAALGTALEWSAAEIQLRLFHSVSWDYSGMRLQLGGRISLMMTLLWGALGLAASALLPLLLSERLQGPRLRRLCCLGWGLMALDLLMSAVLLARWGGGRIGTSPPGSLLFYVDRIYDAAFFARRFVEWSLLL